MFGLNPGSNSAKFPAKGYVSIQKDTILNQQSYYFSDALIYEYEENGNRKELWFYTNSKTKQVLYVPSNDMIAGVISFPDGTYKIYGRTESGKDTVLVQQIAQVLINDKMPGIVKKIALTKVIDQTNIQQRPIYSLGYLIKYLKMEGEELIYVTDQIPINSRQIYGFCKLDGDARIDVKFDYLNVLSQDQTITHIDRKGFSLRLTNYGPNPYYFNMNK